MSNQLQWTEELGNAFLAQQADVMSAVQSLRHEAMAAGNLKQTAQCRCAIQTSGETISILPTEPQHVCVPVYSPVVYGAWPYPAYPPFAFPVPVGFAYEPGFWIGFGPPIAVASLGMGVGRLGASPYCRRSPPVTRSRPPATPPSRAAFGCMTPPIAAASAMPMRLRGGASMQPGLPQ